MSITTLALAKECLSVDYDDQDTLIQKRIDGAENYVECVTGYKLTNASVTEYCSGGDFALRPIERLPISTISSIYDTEVGSTLAATAYHVRRNAIYRDSELQWDAGPINRWRVIYVGGYTAANLPPGLESIILDLVYRSFNSRGGKAGQGAAGYSVNWQSLMDSDMLRQLDTFRDGGSLFG